MAFISSAKIIPIHDIQWNETIAFLPPIQSGQVIKVYDGDTITIATKLPYKDSPLYRFPVRLKGIDSAEIKSKNANEKIHAKIARDALSDLILHKNVTIQNIENEKYGRILADVYYNELCINEWMIEKGYAVKYDGGTKQIPTAWTE
jgi:micrococcal nuclease